MSRFCLIGEKLSHSISPIIHNKIYDILNINASYDLVECKEEELSLAIEKIRNGEYQGANVTIPYKEKVIKYLDSLSTEALSIGAVNTIVRENNKLVGYNTDYFGIKRELIKHEIDPANKTAVILGNGGAAKATYKCLLDLGAKVLIVSRNKNTNDNIISYDELNELEDIYLIINSTPVGMYPQIDASPISLAAASRAKVIVDLIYNPQKTKLMSYNDCSYNGLYMLVAQAVKAFELWYGSDFAGIDKVYDYIKDVMK